MTFALGLNRDRKQARLYIYPHVVKLKVFRLIYIDRLECLDSIVATLIF
jgi:hypothetical protein